MPVRCQDYERACVISVEGDLTAENTVALRRVAEERMDVKKLVEFVVDLEKCSFADSEGLESLLWLKRRCDDLFGQLKLAGPDDNFRKILEITRLEPRFDCQKDLTEALKTMR